jgi:hypothetical protein
MDKEQPESFFCFNCGAKNYFDKAKYSAENKSTDNQNKGETRSEEVSVECKSCREINVVLIELN